MDARDGQSSVEYWRKRGYSPNEFTQRDQRSIPSSRRAAVGAFVFEDGDGSENEEEEEDFIGGEEEEEENQEETLEEETLEEEEKEEETEEAKPEEAFEGETLEEEEKEEEKQEGIFEGETLEEEEKKEEEIEAPADKRKYGGAYIFGELFRGSNPEVLRSARTGKILRHKSAKKDLRNVTILEAYKVLDTVLTYEETAGTVLLYNGVFFFPAKFEQPDVSKAFSKMKRFGSDEESDEEKRRFLLFLCGWLVTLLVHLPCFIDDDTKMKKKSNFYVEPKKEKDKRGQYEFLQTVNPMIWDVIRLVPAKDTVKSCDYLNEEDQVRVGEEKSMLEMLGLGRYSDGTANTRLDFKDKSMASMGILAQMQWFKPNGNAGSLVSTVSSCCQMAYRLGRFVSLPSMFFAVAPRELEVLQKISWADCTSNPFVSTTIGRVRDSSGVDAGRLSLAGRTLLSYTDGNFYPSLPLIRILHLTRPDGHGQLRAGSSDVWYSKMGRFYDLIVKVTRGEKGDDGGLLSQTDDCFLPVQRESRRQSAVETTCDKKVGHRKVERGRMLADLDETCVRVYDMVAHMKRNAFEPVMKHVSLEQRDMCWGILEKEKGSNNTFRRKNEDHLYTLEVESAVEALADRVSCEDVSRMMAAMMLVMPFVAAPLRSQDAKGIMPKDTRVITEDGVQHLVDVLPDDPKDAAALMQSSVGMEMLNKKHPVIEREYAVMTVLGRGLLRRANPGGISELVGPLLPTGVPISEDQRARLFENVGQHFLGIPKLSEHVCRSVGASVAMKWLVKEGKSFDSFEVQSMVSAMRTSPEIARRNYDVFNHSRFVASATYFDYGSTLKAKAAEGAGEKRTVSDFSGYCEVSRSVKPKCSDGTSEGVSVHSLELEQRKLTC